MLIIPSVAIDYTPAHDQGGGIGRYVRELVFALGELDAGFAYRLFVAGASLHDLGPLPGLMFQWKSVPISQRWLARLWHRMRVPLPVDIWVGRVKVFHATDFVLPPTLPSTSTVVTVHDLTYARVPDSALPSLRRYLEAVVPFSVHRADVVIVDSYATFHDLVDLYRVPVDKMRVLWSGVEERFFEPVSGLSQMTIRKYLPAAAPYILCVGTIQPRKNIQRLIRALRIIRAQGYDLDLVIAGGKGWLDSPIFAEVAHTGLQAHVHFTGFVDEHTLRALYQGATCIAFPSLYEGFGLPILEGMASGVPVVTSNVSSMPEVAGDAAILVDPYDIEAIAEGLRRAIGDTSLREDLIVRGRARARMFTWRRAAEQLVSIYHELIERH